MLEGGNTDIVLGVYDGDVENAIYSEHTIELDQVDIAVTPDLAKTWKDTRSLEGMIQMLNSGRVDAILSTKLHLLSETVIYDIIFLYKKLFKFKFVYSIN